MSRQALFGLAAGVLVLSACATAPRPLPSVTEIPASEVIGLTHTEIMTRLGLQSDGEVYASVLREEDGAIYAEVTGRDLAFGARCVNPHRDWNLRLRVEGGSLVFRDGRLESQRGPQQVVRAICWPTDRGMARTFVRDGGLYSLPFLPLAVVSEAMSGSGDDPGSQMGALSRIVVGEELPADVATWIEEHPRLARATPGANAGETDLRFYWSGIDRDDRPAGHAVMRGTRAVAIIRVGDSFSGLLCRVVSGRSMLCGLGSSDVRF